MHDEASDKSKDAGEDDSSGAGNPQVAGSCKGESEGADKGSGAGADDGDLPKADADAGAGANTDAGNLPQACPAGTQTERDDILRTAAEPAYNSPSAGVRAGDFREHLRILEEPASMNFPFYAPKFSPRGSGFIPPSI